MNVLCSKLNNKKEHMKYIFSIFIFLSIFTTAQSKIDSIITLDKKYLEDQLFISVTYNLLTKKPSSISLRGFSNTTSLGYIRDFPINGKRNIGFGLGLGYSRHTYFHNMKINIENNQTFFRDFEDIDIHDSNKLVYNSIDIPFEFRIRNSTFNEHKFFRLYFGMSFSYIFHYKSEYNLHGAQKFSGFDHFNKFQYGLTSSIGYGTWNGYFVYGLTNIFDNAKFNGTEKINIKSIRFGLIFYIL